MEYIMILFYKYIYVSVLKFTERFLHMLMNRRGRNPYTRRFESYSSELYGLPAIYSIMGKVSFTSIRLLFILIKFSVFFNQHKPMHKVQIIFFVRE